jgi:hypothetical protein
MPAKAARKAQKGPYFVRARVRNSGRVVFLRAENYMALAKTRRELVFLDSQGNEVEVIHAFAVVQSSVNSFLKEYEEAELGYKEITPPSGWRIYALPWEEVQQFVAYSCSRSLLDFSGGVGTDVPPPILKFKRRHAIRNTWDYVPCWCGSSDCPHGGDYRISPVTITQVVFASRPVVRVVGRPTRANPRCPN